LASQPIEPRLETVVLPLPLMTKKEAANGGAVSKRRSAGVLRRVKADWDDLECSFADRRAGCAAFSMASVLDMRLDHKGTAISLSVVLGARMAKRCCSAQCPRRSDRPVAPRPSAHSRCKTPAGIGRQQSYRCTTKMYLIRMSWLRGAGTAKTGRDRGRSRIDGAEFWGDHGFPWPSLTGWE